MPLFTNPFDPKNNLFLRARQAEQDRSGYRFFAFLILMALGLWLYRVFAT